MLQSPGHSERLRRLLALKRHEVPPPRFFEDLPQQIRARIERENRRRPSLGSWWRRLSLEWDLKPALAGAVLIAAGGIFFFGLNPDEPTARHQGLSLQGHGVPAWAASAAGSGDLLAETNADPFSAGTNDSPSTRAHGFRSPPLGMFEAGFRLRVDQASFGVGPREGARSNSMSQPAVWGPTD